MESRKAQLIAFLLLNVVHSCSLNGSSTKYCPLSHRLILDYHCRVVDNVGEKVLVEHFDCANNKTQLSIHEKGKTIFIQHPYGHMDGLSPKLDDNIIKFHPTRKNYLLVNGKDFKIIFLQQQ